MIHNILPYTPRAREFARALRKRMTPCERIFWNRVRKRQLKVQFFRQFPILDYVVDFYVKEIGLAVEIDGSIHEQRILEDAQRQGRIEQLGVRFIRFTNQQIEHDIDSVILEISKHINEYKIE